MLNIEWMDGHKMQEKDLRSTSQVNPIQGPFHICWPFDIKRLHFEWIDSAAANNPKHHQQQQQLR